MNVIGYLKDVRFAGWMTTAFVAVTYLFYSAIYVLPVVILLWVLDRLLRWNRLNRLLQRVRLSPTAALCIFAVVTTTLLQVLLFADRFIFHLYGFHINGFVWNLVFTKGGIESLGGDTATAVSFGLIIAGLLAIQIGLLMLVLFVKRIPRLFKAAMSRRTAIVAVIVTFTLGAFSQISFGMSVAVCYTPILAASNAFPLYVPLTFTKLVTKMGIEPKRTPSVAVEMGPMQLAYPAKPIQCEPPAKPYNIIFLIAESLRWDMLDPTIMPATWALAQKSLWCRDHYSGANLTRMAMFSMFYGLYGSYWFQFVNERRSPLLMDVLIDQNYQMEMYNQRRLFVSGV